MGTVDSLKAAVDGGADVVYIEMEKIGINLSGNKPQARRFAQKKAMVTQLNMHILKVLKY